MKKLIFIFLVCGMLACNDESLKNETSYDFSSENILSFTDGAEAQHYFSDSQTKGKTSFHSFRSVFLTAVDQLSEVTTSEAHSKLLDQYRDVVSLENETYVPTITNTFYNTIINRDRLYVSNNLVHKVIDNEHIVFTDKKNTDQLLRIESVRGLNKDIFTVVNYQQVSDGSGGRTLANCGNDLRQDYFDNHSNCKDDRRAWVHGYAYFNISGYYYYPAALAECYAERRTGTFCNWKLYDNVFYTKNCSFTLRADMNGTSYSYPMTFLDYSGTGYESEHILQNGNVTATPIYWSGGATPAIQFSAIHLEGSSQGVGANDPTHWAVINCQ